MRYALPLPFILAAAFAASPAYAQVAEPGPRDEEAFDVMNLLADRGLHELQNERWNAYGQYTYISSFKQPFSSPYQGIHSLLPEREHSYTASLTLYLAAALWHGGEAYLVPELISERPLSELRGLGGSIQNFELQKGGGAFPTLYRSRAFVRHTVSFGGDRIEKTSDPSLGDHCRQFQCS
jgi:high affinity Mn2+ porin